MPEQKGTLGIYWTGDRCPEYMRESWMDETWYNCIAITLQLGKGLSKLILTAPDVGHVGRYIRAVQM